MSKHDAYYRKYANAAGVRPYCSGTCQRPGCGGTWEHGHPNKRYCCGACRVAHFRELRASAGGNAQTRKDTP